MRAKKITPPSFDPHEKMIMKMSFMSHGQQKTFLQKEKDEKFRNQFRKLKK